MMCALNSVAAARDLHAVTAKSRHRLHLNPVIGDSTSHHRRNILTSNEPHQIIVNAFYNARYGISPTATRGAVESHARKHQLHGDDYTKALESAIAAGLLAPMAGSSFSIRNAGRSMLPKR